MKKIMIMVTAVLIASCSQKPQGSAVSELTPTEKIEQNVLQVLPLTMTVNNQTTSFDTVSQQLEFGSIFKGLVAKQQLLIQNSKTSSLAINVDPASDLGQFTISANSCPASLTASRSCIIELSLNTASLAENLVLEKSITINGIQIPLTATIVPAVVVNPSEIFSITPSNLALGSVERGSLKQFTISVYNGSNSSQLISFDSFGSQPGLSYSGCINSNLGAKRACQISVKIDSLAATDAVDQLVNKSLKIAQLDYSYSYTLTNPAPIVESNFKPIAGSETANLGTINDINSKEMTVTFSNASSMSMSNVTASVSGPFIVDAAKSTCLNRPVYAKRSCTVVIKADSTNQPTGSYNVAITLKSGVNNYITTAPVNAVVVINGNTCTSEKVMINNECILRSSLINENMVSQVAIINEHSVKLNGINLDNVATVIIKKGSIQITTQVISQTASELVAKISEGIQFAAGEAFELIIGNAYGQAIIPAIFEISDRSITLQKIAGPLGGVGVSAGQILKFNGTNWVASNLIAGQNYLGMFNENTVLPNSMSAGDYYIVDTSGSYDINSDGNPISTLAGDWLVYNGSSFDKLVNSSLISSFNGRKGAVVPLAGDYGWSDLKKASGKITGSVLNEIADIDTTGVANGQALIYNSAEQKWMPANVSVDLSSYATQSQVASAISAITTSTVSEGSNLYFTQARVLGTQVSGISSSNTAIVNGDSIVTALGKVQGQLDAKQSSSSYVDWAASGIQTIHPARLSLGLGNAGKAMVTDSSGFMVASNVTETELSYLSGANGNIQTQINNLVSAVSGKLDASGVLALPLTGFSPAITTAVLASDSIVGAFGKLQGQINNLLTGTSTLSSDANSTLTLGSSGALPSSGTVSKLNVYGSITTPPLLISGTAVDFRKSNVAYCTTSCTGAMALQNLANGGSYTLVFQDSQTTTPANFTATSLESGAALSTIYNPALYARTAGKKAIFNVLRVGSEVYVTWSEF